MYGGKFAFQNRLRQLVVERKFTILLCFTLYSRANSKYKPSGGVYSEGRFNGGFFALRFWGAYIWRGLFSEFYGIWINERLTFGILWKFNPIWLFFLLSGRYLLPKYYFSKFNCTSRPLFTICLVISIIPTCLTMQ